RRFQRPLDMGCGSGILALAMAKTWRVPVVASDIDPESARVTRLNARQNGVGPLVRAVCGRGYRSQAVARSGPYDLIVANILARPLIKMAGDLVRHLRPARQGGGTAILSGLLARDARWVAAAHEAWGLRLNRTMVHDGWATLVLSR
ncbi:MAG: methyltransferase domain-containing protein, partial [Rhodospirillaceae bacterium]|nr:methyltransferase domain-containing protein [Rhodospirillaceae bacterium]